MLKKSKEFLLILLQSNKLIQVLAIFMIIFQQNTLLALAAPKAAFSPHLTRVSKGYILHSFQSNFRTMSLTGLNPASVKIVHRHLQYVLVIQLKDTDPDVNGTKQAIGVSLPAGSYSGSYNYYFSEYLPSNYTKDRSAESIALWTSYQDIGFSSDLTRKVKVDEPWHSPAFAILTQNGHLWVTGRWDPNNITLNDTPGPGGGIYSQDLGPYKTKRWNHFRLHVQWSYGKEGGLELYDNNELIFKRLGPNCYNDWRPPGMQLGIYKEDWTKHPGFSQVHHRSLILGDDIREDWLFF